MWGEGLIPETELSWGGRRQIIKAPSVRAMFLLIGDMGCCKNSVHEQRICRALGKSALTQWHVQDKSRIKSAELPATHSSRSATCSSGFKLGHRKRFASISWHRITFFVLTHEHDHTFQSTANSASQIACCGVRHPHIIHRSCS